ncbi:anthrax toxin receptor-like isoform X2 [Talpa occidentalis]|uniref:anthrax toxin receptor-like isoform X2 n=1 Tax=Talpa occidentalis TaxID=50954 RepID=UPI0023F89795|nr:anthrax toxin receptor-like isoform X2 [Talpa occidentalis]
MPTHLRRDLSGSVDTNWIHVYGFVEDFLKKFDNPNMRVSIVTYSTQGDTVLKLTSDKKEIKDGLNRLRNTVPTGATNMQEGFKAVNEQIANANSGGEKVHSMVISLTDGALTPEAFQETKNEARLTRQMGGTVYALGVNTYRKYQLMDIADSRKHVFGVDTGFADLRNVADFIADMSCIEVTKMEPTEYCMGENFDVTILGRGFHNTKNINQVLCRIKINDNRFFDIKATQVEDTSIKCPGAKIEEAANNISVEVSLNNGASFISNGLKINIKDCGGDKNVGVNYSVSTTTVKTPVSTTVKTPVSTTPVKTTVSTTVKTPVSTTPVNYPDATMAVPEKGTNIQFPDINFYHLLMVVGIILIPLVIWLLWRYFFEKETCSTSCPMVLVLCGAHRDQNVKHQERKLESCCTIFNAATQAH